MVDFVYFPAFFSPTRNKASFFFLKKQVDEG